MKILVTGGTGTIGGYVLRELLSSGHTVSNYSRTVPAVDGVPTIHGDIMDLDQLRAASRGHEAIIHLAAVPGPGRATPEKLIDVNVIGTVNALEAAVAANARKLVFASSGAAFDSPFARAPSNPPTSRSTKNTPANPKTNTA